MALQTPLFGQIEFQDLDFDAAKQRAIATGKNLFVDFRADWCKPCVEMERTTFQNKEVGRAINTKYIPLSVDVEYFTGMDIKEMYNVSVMPTILIINGQGDVQQRMLGLKTPESLMNELKLPYYGTDDKNTTVKDNKKDVDTIKKEKKEFFLCRWWRKITS